MQKMITLAFSLILLMGCSDNVENPFHESSVQLGTHQLKAYSQDTGSKYLVVFESGLGDDHAVWLTESVAQKVSKTTDVLLYDRGGYGKSTIDNNPRNIDRLRMELEAVVDEFATDRKVILVGHSLGGLIIRDYAIKNPDKTAALLFVDPSHEYYNEPTQELEDDIYDAFANAYGSKFGGTKEVRMLLEDFEYISSVPGLPNVPVVVLTSMKNDQSNKSADQTYGKTRQDWYDAHEQLKNGVEDFTHIQTTKSGHYIMREQPGLVVNNIQLLISKLPL